MSSILVAMLVWSPEAEACTCSIERQLSPADGAAGVPLNSGVLARGSTAPVNLRASGSQVIPLTEEVAQGSFGGVLRYLRPTDLLQPGRTYELEMGGTINVFTTADTSDLVAPLAPELHEASAFAATIEGGSTCDRYNDLYVEVQLNLAVTDDTGYLELAFKQASSSDAMTMWVAPADLGNLRSRDAAYCGILPPRMEAGETWCLSARAYDLAGNASGWSAEQCFKVQRCEANDYTTGCQPVTGGCSSGGGPPVGLLLVAAAVPLLAFRRTRPKVETGPRIC
jgi:hypothetical protein